MAIHGLNPRFAVLGYIKIGGLKNVETRYGMRKLPTKFDHFEVTTTERNDDGYLVDEDLMAQLKTYEKRSDGKVTKIVVLLPSDEPEKNLISHLCYYDSLGIRCRGDGTRAEFYDAENNTRIPVRCPCNLCRIGLEHSMKIDARPAHPYLELDVNKGKVCKPRGNLHVMISAARTLGGIHSFHTTSKNTIQNLYMAMYQIKKMTGGVLADCVPLELSISSKRVKPESSDKKQLIYTVNLTFRAEPLEFLQNVANQAQLRAAVRDKITGHSVPPMLAGQNHLFTVPGNEPKQQQRYIAEEYYPHEEEPYYDADGVVYEVTPDDEDNSCTKETIQTDCSENADPTPPDDTFTPPEDDIPPPLDEFDRIPPPFSNEDSETSSLQNETPKEEKSSPKQSKPLPTETPETSTPTQYDMESFEGKLLAKLRSLDVSVSIGKDDDIKQPVAKETLLALITLTRQLGYPDEVVKIWVTDLYKVKKSTELCEWQARSIIEALKKFADA